MVTTLAVISTIFILLSVLPFIQHQHWLFRVAEFIKIQLVILQIIAFGITMIYVEDSIWLWIVQTVQFILIVYHIYILMRYTKFWKKQKPSKTSSSSDKINIISCNIYQFNSEYHRFIELIEQEQPDIFVTMESNADWEKALHPLEKDY